MPLFQDTHNLGLALGLLFVLLSSNFFFSVLISSVIGFFFFIYSEKKVYKVITIMKIPENSNNLSQNMLQVVQISLNIQEHISIPLIHTRLHHANRHSHATRIRKILLRTPTNSQQSTLKVVAIRHQDIKESERLFWEKVGR